MSIRLAYEESLRREGHTEDPAQLDAVDRLQDLQQRIVSQPLRKGGLRSMFFRSEPRELVRGMYLWGGVGRGKTFLMDLFFETLTIEKKRRVHFHRMMHEVHARLRTLSFVENPLDKVAEGIAQDTRVLCFDEFFVSDIGDAMILAGLLEGLFSRGVTLVTTSNARPDDLYKNGLQRQQFLPAIELLNEYTDVVHMAGSTDYRLRLLQKAGTYLTPNDAAATDRLEYFFTETAVLQIEADAVLEINDRPIVAYRRAKGIAWFEFSELCDGPRSQNDYIELARWYPSIIVSGLPQFDATRDDQARRFISLVDEFYDRHVKLILSADVDVQNLYTGKRLSFEFERTISRLVEMQSTDYLALPHLA